MSELMLQVQGVHAAYDGIRVLNGISLEVRRGEIVTLIGANGAGKTTLLRVVSGVLPPLAGRVLFEGRDITRLPAHKIARRGLQHIQEGRVLFRQMTVWENLLMGAASRRSEEIQAGLDAICEIFPILHERRRQAAGTLSGGEQQMLVIGRALMARPRLLMMDEPSLGLAPILVSEVFAKIRELKSAEVAILLVEQNAKKALQVGDRGYVLEVGNIVLEGSTQQLRTSPKVRDAYLGVSG